MVSAFGGDAATLISLWWMILSVMGCCSYLVKEFNVFNIWQGGFGVRKFSLSLESSCPSVVLMHSKRPCFFQNRNVSN